MNAPHLNDKLKPNHQLVHGFTSGVYSILNTQNNKYMKTYDTSAFFYLFGVLSGLIMYYAIDQISKVEQIPIHYELKEMFRYETGTRYSLSIVNNEADFDAIVTFGSGHVDGILPSGIYNIEVK